MNLADEVRRIVAADPSALNRRMSRNENNRLPLHFAVRMNRPEMVALLVELGPIRWRAMVRPPGGGIRDVARHRSAGHGEIRAMTRRSWSAPSADTVRRRGTMDLLALLALGDWETAARLLRENPGLIEPGGAGRRAAPDGEAK